MHSLEHIRIINDKTAMKGTRQKLVGMELVNAETNERSCSRTFVTIESARNFCNAVGAEFAGVSK